ncbi:MAG: 16S rRNA (cytosine(967)-C(5))-methyltransferase RsmB [Gammaproteobacteria bacterium]|nr:16S rRNA (cytosine(967)-C(5))-methyltransferase RsmB [Gammaproteobacteria bacterium]
MSDKTTSPRWLALKSLLLVVQRGRSLDEALKLVLQDKEDLDHRDLALCRALAYGVCRWYLTLQKVLKDYLRKPIKKKDTDLEVILMLGLYQLVMMDVDHHAAVNETVKLTLWQKKSWAKGLVNAVLRGAIRDQVKTRSSFDNTSYPDWIKQKLTQDWPQQAESILVAGNQQAPMVLRVDLRQISMSECIASLQSQGHLASAHALVDSAVILHKPCNVNAIDGFNRGLLSVQDAAPQLAAELLDCQPGMHVLDACAAPGGKTAHLLQATDRLELIALDQDQKRLDLVAENLQRIDCEAKLQCGDATCPDDWFGGRLFDRILADVPCSASGVIRRHPDIKLLRRAGDIAGLVAQQRRVLTTLWQLLKPEGVLLYSTCSVFKDENEHQIDWFVQNNDNCSVLGLKSVQWGEDRPCGRQILPGSENMDGFYYACLRKAGIPK